jgi:hypothetical protein
MASISNTGKKILRVIIFYYFGVDWAELIVSKTEHTSSIIQKIQALLTCSI